MSENAKEHYLINTGEGGFRVKHCQQRSSNLKRKVKEREDVALHYPFAF